jgi:hypothetical protein
MSLDENVTAHVSDAMRIKAREFDEALALRFMDIDTQSMKSGGMGGSRHTLQFIVACREDLRNRANYIFAEIQRALSLYPQQNDEQLLENLRALFKAVLGRQVSSLDGTLSARTGSRAHIPVTGQLDEEFQRLDSKYTFELGNFLIAASRSRTGPTQGGIHIHGNVGSLLTGMYASAVVEMNIGDDSREALEKALDLVAATIRDNHQLAAEARRQLAEVVELARASGKAQPPNPSILRGMFTVLCETLQTLGAAAPALAALREAAQPFGIYF